MNEKYRVFVLQEDEGREYDAGASGTTWQKESAAELTLDEAIDSVKKALKVGFTAAIEPIE